MKKTTLYRRKRRAPARQYNAAEWLNVIQRRAGYTPDAPAGSWLGEGTQDAADNAVNRVMTAFASIKTAQLKAAKAEDTAKRKAEMLKRLEAAQAQKGLL